MELTYEAIARRIDHSLLGPTLTEAELEAGCRGARILTVDGKSPVAGDTPSRTATLSNGGACAIRPGRSFFFRNIGF